MNKSNTIKHVVSANGINYYTVCSEVSLNERSYGIKAEIADNKDDSGECDNLFFTESEANAYCKWFAENEVYPVTLKDILSNIFNI